MNNPKSGFLPIVMRIIAILMLVFFFSCSFLACKQDTNPDKTPQNESISNDKQENSGNSGIEGTDNSGSDLGKTDNSKSSDQANDWNEEELVVNSKDVLKRSRLFSYPAIMGPPSQYNSTWTSDRIFVNSGKAGFTKIDLEDKSMLESSSFLINKEFIGSSSEYFLCKDQEAVFCLVKENAKELWAKPLSSVGLDYYFPVNNDIVARMEFNQTKREGYVFGYDAKTGTSLWERKLANQNETFLGFSPSVVLFTKDENLIGVDPQSGVQLWSLSSILKPGDDIYVSDFYRNFIILDDQSLLIPSSDEGEPLAYRIHPVTGKVLAEYRYDSQVEVHFQSTFFETPTMIINTGRMDTRYSIVAFNKETGKIMWEKEINSILGPFEKKYGVQCRYSIFESKPNELYVETSDTSLICLDLNTGKIHWNRNLEFSQIKTFWNDLYQIRVHDQDDTQINLTIVDLATGDVRENILLPSNYSLPTAPVSLLYSSESHFLLRVQNNNQIDWLVYELNSNNEPEFYGLLSDTQENSTTLVFYVSNKDNEFLFLVSGEKGYELEIFTIHKNISL